jgi:hypothetical protein
MFFFYCAMKRTDATTATVDDARHPIEIAVLDTLYGVGILSSRHMRQFVLSICQL